jgi:hypothetical protein
MRLPNARRACIGLTLAFFFFYIITVAAKNPPAIFDSVLSIIPENRGAINAGLRNAKARYWF